MTNPSPFDPCYPLQLEPVFRERIWGGDALARVAHKTLPAQVKIGETWEAWDGCAIANGPLRGQTLAQVVSAHRARILGSAGNPAHGFPLLFKYLDARDNLSVQVHPDDAGAKDIEDEPRGKTEAWYVLDAEPGAQIIHGFRSDANPDAVRSALSRRAMAEMLEAVPVQRGDVFFVPAGTVHALGKGVVIAEIQQHSDITYRLYDWDRVDDRGRPRELHVEKALQVCDYDALSEHRVPSLAVKRAYGEQTYLVACRYFVLEQLSIERETDTQRLGGKFHILACLEGSAEIRMAGETTQMRAGETFVLPACLDAYRLRPGTNASRLLRMYVPSLQDDVIVPLQQAGFSRGQINALGGPVREHNDLVSIP